MLFVDTNPHCVCELLLPVFSLQIRKASLLLSSSDAPLRIERKTGCSIYYATKDDAPAFGCYASREVDMQPIFHSFPTYSYYYQYQDGNNL